MTLNDDLRHVFKEEAIEFIEDFVSLTTKLSHTEGAAFEDHLADLLRTAHNLKGAATTAGFRTVEGLAHAFEGYMAGFKGVSGPLSDETVECAFEMFGVLQDEIEKGEDETKVQEILSRLASLGADVPPMKVPASSAADSDAEQERGAPDDNDGTKENSVRVNTAKLDQLMGFIGDFLMFRTRLADRQDRQKAVFKELQQLSKDRPEVSRSLTSIIAGLRRLTREGAKDMLDFSNLTDTMNETAKQLRTVPLRGAIHVWRRIVRDADQICGKRTRLDVDVGNIKIDRHVLERISDPLMHILRNAVDHGIEPESEREAKGKTRQGRIVVAATLQGAMIRLEVSDDGRGIDTDAVRRTAVDRGLISLEDAQRLNEGQLADFLFRTGFSTTNRTSRISGRGVGMDVVRTQLEELGGSVEILARGPLGGTTLVLWVPVSILSSEGLLVRCGKATYALPIESVSRTLRAPREWLKTADGKSVVVGEGDGDDPLRVVSLSELMGKGRADGDTLNVVVLGRGKSEIGLIVDKVLGLKEYVIQALPWNYKRIPGINGAILDADGSVTILLDVLHIFESIHQNGRAVATSAAPKSRQKVLLVDDSLSSRTLQRSMLRADGYDVTLASDGAEAWQLLQNEIFNLVVSDVQMPKMDGFELTRRIRGAVGTKDLPVILVTSLTSDADRAKGADAGADDFLTKGSFDQNGLLSIVSRYLG